MGTIPRFEPPCSGSAVFLLSGDREVLFGEVRIATALDLSLNSLWRNENKAASLGSLTTNYLNNPAQTIYAEGRLRQSEYQQPVQRRWQRGRLLVIYPEI
jgi:hypothetical protein